MNNEQKLAAIDFWQDEAPYHPLTCGNKSSHALLRGIWKANPVTGEVGVVLNCADCGYVQTWVPEYVYEAYEGREFIREMKRSMPGCRNADSRRMEDS